MGITVDGNTGNKWNGNIEDIWVGKGCTRWSGNGSNGDSWTNEKIWTDRKWADRKNGGWKYYTLGRGKLDDGQKGAIWKGARGV